MTTRHTNPVPDQREPAVRPARHLPRLELSATQLVASALAAITATVAASYLGVSGTVAGAAVASVLTALGNAVYGHSLRSTGTRVREVVPGAVRFAPRAAPGAPTAPTAALPTVRPSVAGEQPPTLPSPIARPRPERRSSRPRAQRHTWRRVAIGAVTVFAAVLAVVTGIEVVGGRPISDLLRGNTGSGTTLFGGDNAAHAGPTTPPSAPTVTQTVIPSVVVTTPTVTRTAAPVTQTTTPTTTPPPSTPTPSDSGSGTTGTGAASRTPAH